LTQQGCSQDDVERFVVRADIPNAQVARRMLESSPSKDKGDNQDSAKHNG
jgi:hypothetical protein